MWGIQFGIMLCMIVLNGIMAAFEIALASITLPRVKSLADSGRRGAKAALKMKQSMEGSLAVVQLGITFVGSIAGATAGVGAEEQLAPFFQSQLRISETASEIMAIIFVVLPLTAFMIVFGELIPKVFALRNPELVVLRLSPPMKVFSYVVWPLVWLLEGSVQQLLKWIELLRSSKSKASEVAESTELQELRASVAIARTSRLIGSQQEKIILGAAELSQRPVREIMLPTEFISFIDADLSAGDALIAAHLDMHTRFPVTERPGDPQGIIGYVMFKDIVAHLRFSPEEDTIRNIVRKINRYSADLPIAQVLERLIHHRAHIALVTDSAGQIVGMVTMEDMIEELIGEMEDEYDRLPFQAVATGRGWIVGGGLSLSALERQTGIALPPTESDEEIRNLNDWITARIDGPIRGSETIETSDLRILVRKTRRHKVMEAYLSPKGESPERRPSDAQ
ncbi:hemolysin family protein [Planctomicrobium sp. SH661]|uniref:hemolysin family protein n=1 Tax=Planctomicrobium sp. SH661 TaxID=3448124 RepID=UPI003F5AEF19